MEHKPPQRNGEQVCKAKKCGASLPPSLLTEKVRQPCFGRPYLTETRGSSFSRPVKIKSLAQKKLPMGWINKEVQDRRASCVGCAYPILSYFILPYPILSSPLLAKSSLLSSLFPPKLQNNFVLEVMKQLRGGGETQQPLRSENRTNRTLGGALCLSLLALTFVCASG